MRPRRLREDTRVSLATINHGLAPAARAAPTAPWWRGASIYQIYPRSFADSNADGIGDLPGLAARLDYVAELGVDAIWISPFFRSPMADFGYDVADFCDVDPIFGTMADFDQLVARAHALGLRVIIDQVYSHTSDQHAWFAQSRQSRSNPKADWYVWADPKADGSPPSNWQSVFGGPAWTWDARRGQYYLHNFLPGQPDLNVHNPAVQDAIMDTMRFWLDRGVDGFRLDAVNFMMHDPSLRDNPPAPDDGRVRTRPFDYQQKLYNQSHPDIVGVLERLRQVAEGYDAAFLLAEVGGERAHEEMRLYTEPPARLHSAYGFMYLYADALTPALVRAAEVLWPDAPDHGWPSWTFSNHDAPRAISRWSGGRDLDRWARLTLVLLATLRGNSILFQGDELGLPQADVPFERLQDPEALTNWPLTLGRDGARTPMPWRAGEPHAGFSPVEPWLPVDPHHFALAVDQQSGREDSTLALARRVMRMRRSAAALRTGAILFHEAADPLLVFERRHGAERWLCAFNLGSAPSDWRLPDGWSVVEAVNGARADAPLPGLGALVARQR